MILRKDGRRALLVLGMHRSGTSALARALVLAGASPPSGLMLATEDNRSGYWESTAITQFNNRLLAKAGLWWSDHGSIPLTWFHEVEREEDRREATMLLEQEFGNSDCFVLMDPRMCRLLPFWLEVLAELGIQPHIITISRDPLEVARSLAARAKFPAYRAAAIEDIEVGLLLWLRYVLDGERHSRNMPRTHVSYSDLLGNWRASLGCVFSQSLLPFPSPEKSAAIDAFIDPTLRRQLSAADCPHSAVPATLPFLRQIGAALASADTRARSELFDLVSNLLNEAVSLYDDSKFPMASLFPSRLKAQISLARIAGLSGEYRSQGDHHRVALFLSGAASSVGHVYRVEHQVAALAEHGWQAYWLLLCCIFFISGTAI